MAAQFRDRGAKSKDALPVKNYSVIVGKLNYLSGMKPARDTFRRSPAKSADELTFFLIIHFISY